MHKVISKSVWEKVNRQLINKMISEFSHERLLNPQYLSDKSDIISTYQIVVDDSTIYNFSARIYHLNHWWIDEKSITKYSNGQIIILDAINFIVEFQKQLGINKNVLPTYLEEVYGTLFSQSYKRLKKPSISAKKLINENYQTIETSMTEGHPSFIANDGRLGFSVEDFKCFSPEADSCIILHWVAALKNLTIQSCNSDLSLDQLYQEELGRETLDYFKSILQEKGKSINDYYLIPVHPWQWTNKLAYLYAKDLSLSNLVYLGPGGDKYKSQQSIRTLFNVQDINKRDPKVALSILNMGFMRGFSPYVMDKMVAINDWVHNITINDSFIRSTGFRIIREVVGFGYRNLSFEPATQLESPYRRMLSALWRENPLKYTEQGENLMTMAALFHIDKDGQSMFSELIDASGLSVEQWLVAFLNAYLHPLLHFFYQYDLIFMPHGQNVMLILKDHQPVATLMKDIAEEVNILNNDVLIDDSMRSILSEIPDKMKISFIFFDIFLGVFRYLVVILHYYKDFTESNFWQCVAENIHRYQKMNPELSHKFIKYNLFTPELEIFCLNRMQIKNNKQMVNMESPISDMQSAGYIKNPIHIFK